MPQIIDLIHIHYTEAHNGYQDWCFGCKAIKEIERLLAGDFTPEEFQNLCHEGKSYPCSPEEFAAGCTTYQKKMFGRAPLSDRIKEMTGAIQNALEELADENLICCKNILENALAGEGTV